MEAMSFGMENEQFGRSKKNMMKITQTNLDSDELKRKDADGEKLMDIILILRVESSPQ